MDKNKKGGPLGDPDLKSDDDARPPGAGAEGGSGFLGDQRQQQQVDRDKAERKEPPLDGTVKEEDIKGDEDEKRPGASFVRDPIWNGPRLNMESRKREPLIIW